jgi:CHAD domain-containing protein
MSNGKWIPDLTATTPLADAARRVLTVRLEVVRDHLPLALREPDKDPEYVHQLRVGTRRARAALDIFAACLPARVARTARKRLRQIRRAAGEARDWDVFLAGLEVWASGKPDKHRPGLDFLTGYALAQRQAAQAHLEAAGQRFPFSFDSFLADTVAAVHDPQDAELATLTDLARPLLLALVKELEHAVVGDLEDYEHLHRVRIIGKRLRYAMEIFADCFPPEFRDRLYPAVEEMQEILGHANDSHVASGRLEALRARLQAQLPAEWKRFRLGFEGLLRFHQRRLPRERRRFLAWWNRWQKSGGLRTLTTVLKSNSYRAAAVLNGGS